MDYSIKYDKFSSIFAVPTEIATSHLNTCGALALKVIIYVLSRPSQQISPKEIAAELAADKYDVRDALNYWAQLGILSCNEGELKTEPKEETKEQPAPQKQAPEPKQEVKTDKVKTVSPKPMKPNVSVVSTRPKLDRGEISRIASRDPMINTLISEVEGRLGKTLNQAEKETLVSLYTYAGLPVDFILMVIGYCVSINKSNIRYIEKTAIGWADKGVDTFEKAENYINKLTKRNSYMVQVKTAFGIYDRALTEKERACIDCWFNKFGYDITMIRLAYERAIDSIGNMSFPYIDKILSNWFKNGIRTPAQASEESQTRKSAPQSPQISESSFNIEELDRLITYSNT